MSSAVSAEPSWLEFKAALEQMEQVDQIKAALELYTGQCHLRVAIREANRQMGLPDEGTWLQQVAALIAAAPAR